MKLEDYLEEYLESNGIDFINKIKTLDNYLDIMAYILEEVREVSKDEWDLIKSDWREFNKRFSVYYHRICPECGYVSYRSFARHLDIHGYTKLDYVLMENNLEDPPKCANPNCNNLVDISIDYKFYKYCSKSCTAAHAAQGAIKKKFGTSTPSFGYWNRTEWNNDKEKYPQYYLSDEDIEHHNNHLQDTCYRKYGSGTGVSYWYRNARIREYLLFQKSPQK